MKPQNKQSSTRLPSPVTFREIHLGGRFEDFLLSKI